jgi:hypothetical protein
MRTECEEIKNKLHVIFERKLCEMWNEDPSPVTIEHRSKFSQRWIDYIGSLGGHVLKWSAALQGSYTPGIVMFKNPGETPGELASMIASPTYILIPDEIAMKILVLGELP